MVAIHQKSGSNVWLQRGTRCGERGRLSSASLRSAFHALTAGNVIKTVMSRLLTQKTEHARSSSRMLPQSVRRAEQSGVFSDPQHFLQQLLVLRRLARHTHPVRSPWGWPRQAAPASSTTRSTRSLLCCTHLNLDLQFSLSLPKCASEIPCSFKKKKKVFFSLYTH